MSRSAFSVFRVVVLMLWIIMTTAVVFHAGEHLSSRLFLLALAVLVALTTLAIQRPIRLDVPAPAAECNHECAPKLAPPTLPQPTASEARTDLIPLAILKMPATDRAFGMPPQETLRLHTVPLPRPAPPPYRVVASRPVPRLSDVQAVARRRRNRRRPGVPGDFDRRIKDFIAGTQTTTDDDMGEGTDE